MSRRALKAKGKGLDVFPQETVVSQEGPPSQGVKRLDLTNPVVVMGRKAQGNRKLEASRLGGKLCSNAVEIN